MGNKQSNSGNNPVLISSCVKEQRTFFPSLQEIPQACHRVSSQFDPASDGLLQRRSSSVSHLTAANGPPPPNGPYTRNGGSHGKTPSSDSGYNTSCAWEKTDCMRDEGHAPPNHCQNTFPASGKQPFLAHNGLPPPGVPNGWLSANGHQHDFLPLFPPYYPHLMPVPPHFLPPAHESKSEKRKRKKHEKEMKKRGITVDLFAAEFPPGAIFSPTWRQPVAKYQFDTSNAPFATSFKARSEENLPVSAQNAVYFPPYVPFAVPYTHQSPQRHPSCNDLRTGLVDKTWHFLPPKEPGKNSSAKRFFKEKKKCTKSIDGLSLKSVETSKSSSIRESLFSPFKNSSKCKRVNSTHRKKVDDETSTRFEEEKIDNFKPSSPAPALMPLVDVRCKTPPPDVIYESLKAARHSTLLTTADIEFEKRRETKENFLNLSQEKAAPIHNADEAFGHQNPVENLEKDAPILSEERQSIVDCDSEKIIEATIEPCLPRRKTSQPANFDPLTSWRALNQISELRSLHDHNHRLDHRANSQSDVDEPLTVRLVECAPPRRPAAHFNHEPIYLEFEQRLPEFKKRLIETGSFNVQELVDRNNDHRRSIDNRFITTARPTDDILRLQDAFDSELSSLSFEKKTTDEKSNLRRLRPNVPQCFQTRLNCKSEDFPEESKPRTVGRLATDGSDIDFSWVHDVERKFNREKEPLDEIEERKSENTNESASSQHKVNESFVGSDQRSIRPMYFGLSNDTSRDVYDNHDIFCGQPPVSPEGKYCSASGGVKEKLAIFEQEAQRLQQQIQDKDKPRQSLENQPMCGRHVQSTDEEPIYIPKPDYDAKNIRNLTPVYRAGGFLTNSDAGAEKRIESRNDFKNRTLAPHYTGHNDFAVYNGHAY